ILAAFVTESRTNLQIIDLVSESFDNVFYGYELFKIKLFTVVFILFRLLQSLAFFNMAYLKSSDILSNTKNPIIFSSVFCFFMIILGPFFSQLYDGWSLDPLLVIVPSNILLIVMQFISITA